MTTRILSDLDSTDAEMGVVFVSDRTIRRYNRDYRQINKATDVLSFAMQEGEGPADDPQLGDVIISLETAQRQAEENKLSLDEEILRLLIHGVLHLHGYDHIEDDDYKEMNALEQKLFRKHKKALSA